MARRKKPTDKVLFRGFVFTRQTVRMIKYAEKKAGFTFHIAQGSFNKGGVAASAGTHDGAAVDFGCAGVPRSRVKRMLYCLKKAGFAAWFRLFGGLHIHAVPFGDLVSPGARDQLVQFDQGRDGLAGRRRDTGINSFRPKPKVKWSWRRNRPVKRK